MRPLPLLFLASTLCACGGQGGRGTDVPSKPLPGHEFLRSYTRAELMDLFNTTQAQLIKVIGAPRCDVSLYRVHYKTLGAAGEAAQANAVITIPSGPDAACSGSRPVLLYAHGTASRRSYDMADLKDNAEARVATAVFAGRGFIMVAPNYAGYAGSTLRYHPFLNATQQAGDMIGALGAARHAGPVFITGYSQGAHVALATQRAIQGGSGPWTVAAAAGMSGPYALAGFVDQVFAGAPTPGTTVFLPMLINSAQRSGMRIYRSAPDIYEQPYAATIEDLFPSEISTGELNRQNKIPKSHLFGADSLPQTPGHEEFFGAGQLIRTAYRDAFLQDLRDNPGTPADPLRRFSAHNDLRNYQPAAPVLLCAGRKDPVVPHTNTRAQMAYWRSRGAGGVQELDLENAPVAPYREQKMGFQLTKALLRATSGDDEVSASYHGGLVAPFCMSAVREFFLNELARRP